MQYQYLSREMKNSPADPARNEMKRIFNEKLKRMLEKRSLRSVLFTKERYDELIEQLKYAKRPGSKLKTHHYRRLNHFDILCIENSEVLIKK